MIELSEAQRRQLESGEPVRATLPSGQGEVLRLRSETYRRIKAVVEVEQAVAARGPLRGPLPEQETWEDPALDRWQAEVPGHGVDVVLLRVACWAEVKELVDDVRARQEFREAGLRRLPNHPH